MVDLEMNSFEESNDSTIPLTNCTCDNNNFGEFCDTCMKYCQQEAELSRLPSFSVTNSPSVWANILMAFSIFLYSANSVIIKEFVVMGGTGSSFLFLRSIVSAPFLLMLIYFFNSDEKKSIIKLDEDKKLNIIMISGCVAGAIRQSLIPFIMKDSEASTIGIISPSIPLVTAVFSHLFKLEKLTKTTVFCLFLSTSGVVFGLDLINKFTGSTRFSYTLMLLIPISKSFQVVFLKMSSDKFDGLTLLRNQIAISILVCLPVSVFFSLFGYDSPVAGLLSLFDFSFKRFLCALYSVLAILFLAWRIQIYCLKILGANAVSLFQTLRPFFTLVLGAFFLGEGITFKKIVGSLIVCLALVIYQKNRVRPEQHH